MTLSVIIPCYNCATTLREAVLSCYRQELLETDFEILMVDDGSSDDTWNLMQTLAGEHSNIRTLKHPQNRGGGAARNTGIAAATGEIIYCLDSDNIFVDNSVKPMLALLKSRGADGVVFHERRFFIDTNINHFTTHTNTILDRSLSLEDIFTGGTLLDNFFYTKAAYIKTAGYPEHHGFDTQCFEMRFLSAGNTVVVCPGSTFLHRQGTDEPSYFTRVHNSGLFSINFMLIFEDLFHLFTPAAQTALVSYPLFSNTHSSKDNVFTKAKEYFAEGALFTSDYRSFLQPDGRTKWLTSQYTTQHAQLVSCFDEMYKGNPNLARTALSGYIQTETTTSPYLHFLSLRVLELEGGISFSETTARALRVLGTMQVRPITHTLHPLTRTIKKIPWLHRILQTLRAH